MIAGTAAVVAAGTSTLVAAGDHQPAPASARTEKASAAFSVFSRAATSQDVIPDPGLAVMGRQLRSPVVRRVGPAWDGVAYGVRTPDELCLVVQLSRDRNQMSSTCATPRKGLAIEGYCFNGNADRVVIVGLVPDDDSVRVFYDDGSSRTAPTANNGFAVWGNDIRRVVTDGFTVAVRPPPCGAE